jgi:hypothetical protein
VVTLDQKLGRPVQGSTGDGERSPRAYAAGLLFGPPLRGWLWRAESSWDGGLPAGEDAELVLGAPTGAAGVSVRLAARGR